MSDHNEAVIVAKGMSPVHVRLRSRLATLLAASVALDLVASVVIYGVGGWFAFVQPMFG